MFRRVSSDGEMAQWVNDFPASERSELDSYEMQAKTK